MPNLTRLTLSDDELRELYAVVNYAIEENFYGDPKAEPWNEKERSAFHSLSEKVHESAREKGVCV